MIYSRETEAQFVADIRYAQGDVSYLYGGDDIKYLISTVSRQAIFVGNIETFSISLRPIFVRFL